MKFLILNGANMNLLGRREVELYGTASYDDLCSYIRTEAAKNHDSVTFFQSNHEGALIDAIQQAEGCYDAMVINPGAYAHYSYAIADALRSVSVPAAEVHLTDIRQREEFRRKSVTGEACRCVIAGHGFAGYAEAMTFLKEAHK
jgi:3-dehydroquinate dehydratase-2